MGDAEPGGIGITLQLVMIMLGPLTGAHADFLFRGRRQLHMFEGFLPD